MTETTEIDTSFEQFSLHPRLTKGVERLNYKKPTPVQQQAIGPAIAGTDLLVCAETGSGKTAAFLLPIIQKLLVDDAPNSSTRALILAPTRELARQIVKNAKMLTQYSHLEIGQITGGDQLKYQKALLRKNPEIVVSTPGRLLELIQHNAADLSDLEVLVLDEADRMLDMGLSEDVLKIADACKKDRQTMLFSATLNPRGLASVIDRVLREPQTLEVNSVREQQQHIVQQRVLVDDSEHKSKCLAAILDKETFHKALVFANTRSQVQKLYGYLHYKGINTGVLHGDMGQDERNHVMYRYRRDQIQVLVATDVAARGLDVDGVELVINFDLARNPEDYIHRIGRTGRAGKGGRAISFITPYDWNLMIRIENFINTKFEAINVSGLQARFKGPKKIKSSGKVAGTKKKKLDKKEAKGKNRLRDKKNIGKPKAKMNFGDGMAPAPIKKT